MDASEIIHKILIYTELNAKKFSDKIGLERPQAIYDIQKGKTKSISQSMADKISSAFPVLNKSWLLTGEGEMIKEDKLENRPNINLTFTEMEMKSLLDAVIQHGENLRMNQEELRKQGDRLDRMMGLIEPFRQSRVG